ncbi:MAG TPA: hypothetical protein VNF74_02595 [Terriglobales bacterium]|nr:hypothetical protein [Terriglobales bacterium]
MAVTATISTSPIRARISSCPDSKRYSFTSADESNKKVILFLPVLDDDIRNRRPLSPHADRAAPRLFTRAGDDLSPRDHPFKPRRPHWRRRHPAQLGHRAAMLGDHDFLAGLDLPQVFAQPVLDFPHARFHHGYILPECGYSTRSGRISSRWDGVRRG